MGEAPDRAFHSAPPGLAGIESLRLPPDFNFIGPMACENCKRLVQVDLMCTDISHLGVHLLILRGPGRCLAPAKAQTNRQGSLSLLYLAPSLWL